MVYAGIERVLIWFRFGLLCMIIHLYTIPYTYSARTWEGPVFSVSNLGFFIKPRIRGKPRITLTIDLLALLFLIPFPPPLNSIPSAKLHPPSLLNFIPHPLTILDSLDPPVSISRLLWCAYLGEWMGVEWSRRGCAWEWSGSGRRVE